MLRTLVQLSLLAALLSFAPAKAVASPNVDHLSGGGTASISQVAMNVSVSGSGSASGSFECLMAGRSGFVLGDFGLVHNMIVHATPSTGSVAGSVATFAGTARLTLDGRQHMDVHVQAWADVATQSFQLTVVEIGTLPIETLESGHLAMS
jgi:hypothetical protein